MKTAKFVSALALALALGASVSVPAFADLPKAEERINIRALDTNKNGKIEKDEYLAFMAKEFDKSAGAKGYCTFEEVDRGFRRMPDRFDVYTQGG